MIRTKRKQFISELENLGRHLRRERISMRGNVLTKENVNTYLKCTKNGYSLKYQLLDAEIDTEEIEDTPVYVYDGASISGLTFKEFETIAEAIRFSVKSTDSKVLFNGEVVNYHVYDEKTAYYVDDRAEKVKIVRI